MSITLYEDQKKAIDRIFGTKENLGLYKRGKRSAAVVMPTGGGKSFVSMSAIENMMSMEEKSDNNKDFKGISEFDMCYFAPNTGILYQFKLHMTEHMILNHYLEEYKKTNIISLESIKNDSYKILDMMYQNGIKKLDFDSTFQKLLKEDEDIANDSPEKIIKKIIKENLKSISPELLSEIIKFNYPNMKFYCYQNLENIDLKKLNSKFFIFDEAHRGGAKTWIKKLEKLVKTKKESFFLSITATPERNKDSRSLIKNIAKYTGYNSDEIQNEAYYAYESYLLEAIENGKVVNPKIVGFPCTLDESSEYNKVIKEIEELKSKGIKGGSANYKKYHALLFIKDKMDEIIGKKGLSEDEWQKKKKEIISKTFLESNDDVKFNPNGKYIAFIPDSKGVELTDEELEKLNENDEAKIKSKKNIQNYINKLKNIFGEDIKSLIYHAVMGNKKNNMALQKFCEVKSNEGGLKFIVTNKKLNEGVHVEDADGEIMIDEISPNEKDDLSSRFLQQIGRCIRAINPNGKKEKTPIIFDYANNFMRNYNLLKKDGKMVLNYDENSAKASQFFELSHIFENTVKDYRKRIVADEEWYEFKLASGKIVKFPDENLEMELHKRNAADRFNTLINTLETLQEVSLDKQINLKNLPQDLVINDDFFKKYNFNDEEKDKIKNVLIESGFLSKKNREYNLGEELTYVKHIFYGIEKDSSMKKVLSDPNLDFSKLANLGVIYLSEKERMLKEYAGIVDINGFIKPTLKILNNEKTDRKKLQERIEFLDRFVGLNVNTGTKYYRGRDEFGCFMPGTLDKDGNDIGGYDLYGYDKDGFNKNGIHRLTGQKYNERYFERITNDDGTIGFRNIITGANIDVFGYDVNGINPETGFDRGRFLPDKQYIKHYWHKYNEENKKFSRIFTEYNIDRNPPVDEYGVENSGSKTIPVYLSFNRERISSKTKELFDDKGLNIDRFNRKGFMRVQIKDKNGNITYKYFHRDTSSEYDLSGRTYDGKLEPNFKDGIDIVTYILKRNKLINNPKERTKIINTLKNAFERNGRKIDDILDKALSMYRLTQKDIRDEVTSDKLKVIEQAFNDSEYEKSLDLIGELSPKLNKQIKDACEHRKMMNNVFYRKMGILFQSFIEEYKSPTNMPKVIQEKLNMLNQKSKKSNLFVTHLENTDADYRDFEEER